MKDTKDVVALFVDHGLFISFARELGRHFKKVYYHQPGSEAFPTLNKGIIGDGYPEIERIDLPFTVMGEIDLAVFPDVLDSDIQEHIEQLGIPVWGSRKADSLEMEREEFKLLQKKLGMDTPPYEVIQGISGLRKRLKKPGECFIKLSKWRGSMETWGSKDYESSAPKLDSLALKFGPMQDKLQFLVEPKIETDIEVGYDGYCINGRFPALGVQGYEAKDRGYLGTIQKYDDMPTQVTSVNDALSDVLKGFNYRNFFSTEIRVKGDKNYLIDPCCRCPSPSTEAQLKLYGNIGDIVWYGAQGELIDPEPTAKFAAEAVLTVKSDKSMWSSVEIPKELDEWIMCGNSCVIDGRVCFPPDGSSDDEIGWLVATGNTIPEVIDNLHKHIEILSGSPITAHTDSLVDLLKQIHQSENQGIEFTTQPIPKPEIAIDL